MEGTFTNEEEAEVSCAFKGTISNISQLPG